MSESSTHRKCPVCGGSIPPNAPQGLCPKCLLVGVSMQTDADEDTVNFRPTPPSCETVAAAFPHLEILEFIGQGGMGCVFKARQPQLNRAVALKILPEALGRDPAFSERFTREAQALAALSHPNIVTIHDFGFSGGFYFLLMEYVDGVNLRQLLRARRLAPAEALSIVPFLCDALQFAHDRGIVHRDIKPENLLLDRDGRVKIADFGIARMLGNEDANTGLTQTKSAGTPGYMAPEQVSSPQNADNRADIYSLGVVFYEMLTGELPSSQIEPPSRKVHIDVRIDEVVLRALEKDPQRRYQTASEVKTRVENVTLTSVPTPAAHSSPNPPRPLNPPSAPGVAASWLFNRWIRGVLSFIFIIGILDFTWPHLFNLGPLSELGGSAVNVGASMPWFSSIPRVLGDGTVQRITTVDPFRSSFFSGIVAIAIGSLLYAKGRKWIPFSDPSGHPLGFRRFFLVVGQHKKQPVLYWPGIAASFLLFNIVIQFGIVIGCYRIPGNYEEMVSFVAFFAEAGIMGIYVFMNRLRHAGTLPQLVPNGPGQEEALKNEDSSILPNPEAKKMVSVPAMGLIGTGVINFLGLMGFGLLLCIAAIQSQRAMNISVLINERKCELIKDQILNREKEFKAIQLKLKENPEKEDSLKWMQMNMDQCLQEFKIAEQNLLESKNMSLRRKWGPFLYYFVPPLIVLWMIGSLFTLLAGYRLLNLQNLSAAKHAAILVLFTPPALPLGWIFGIWTWSILNQLELTKASKGE